MKEKLNKRKTSVKFISSVILLFLVSMSVLNGNIQSNQKMKLYTVKGYLETIGDNDLSASKKYILENIDNSNINFSNKNKLNNSIKYIRFISMQRFKNFKPKKIYFKNGKSRIYLKGSVVKVKYLIKYNNFMKIYEKEKIFIMVKTMSGNYKIVDIKDV